MTAALPETGQTTGPTTGPTATRDRLLDAAEACLRRDGIRRTTVAQVAEEAGLSRAYLYRFFPDKATLVCAALIRRDQAFWDDARARVIAASDLAGMVAEAVAIARTSPLGPLALHLAESEPEAYAEVVGTYVHEVVPGMSGFWCDVLAVARERAWMRADLDLDTAAEGVLRTVVSLVTIPGRAVDADDPTSVRRYLQTFLVPALAPHPAP
ncbi:TetR/AcrR family transcriptional regulator [Nocardioides fonticola]|uniref:TetR/AcrR family transcriptional regulator n=1 Tax=Nocardioides fonticola TaxID=450363 RepID=A0ABP7XH57_9ACTN